MLQKILIKSLLFKIMQIKNSIILVISGAGFNDMITKDFPLNFLFARNPGKVVGKVDKKGNRIE